MKIKLVADSCCDINDEVLEKTTVVKIPLKITVGESVFVDDAALDIAQLLEAIKNSKKHPSTACPSPEEYASAFRGNEQVYVITLSSALSGSYNSAMIAKKIVESEDPNIFVHIFDSKSASAGETKILMHLCQLAEQGLEKEELVAEVEKYIHGVKTLFVLDSLESLVKAGRISKIVGQLASVLSLKPIMGDDGSGKIVLAEKARGTKNAMKAMAKMIAQHAHMGAPHSLVIAYCNCLERAQELKADVIALTDNIKEVFLVPMSGLSTVYANDGGIVVGI